MTFQKFNKLWIALAGTAISIMVDRGIVVPFDEQELVAMVISALTVAGVYKVPNRD